VFLFSDNIIDMIIADVCCESDRKVLERSSGFKESIFCPFYKVLHAAMLLELLTSGNCIT
jgi:hypothetical protein